MEMRLKLENINLSFGTNRIFEDLSISFQKNEINCILGPSGCGKTSLLNIISGLLLPDSIGENQFEDKTVSYVFQEPRLLPWFTVLQNIEYVLKEKITPEQVRSVALEYLKMVRLDAYRDYFPGQLSGGMKQRVSLARAFSFPSDIILMDEPFKGLDIKLKSDLNEAFNTLWNFRKVTVIWVSHDIDEALQQGRNSMIFSGSPVKILGSFKADEENYDQLKKNMLKLLDHQ